MLWWCRAARAALRMSSTCSSCSGSQIATRIAAAVVRECRLQVRGKRWACSRLRSNRIVLWIASRGAPLGPNMIATMLLAGTKRSSAGIALMMACSVSRLMKDLLMVFSVRGGDECAGWRAPLGTGGVASSTSKSRSVGGRISARERSE